MVELVSNNHYSKTQLKLFCNKIAFFLAFYSIGSLVQWDLDLKHEPFLFSFCSPPPGFENLNFSLGLFNYS